MPSLRERILRAYRWDADEAPEDRIIQRAGGPLFRADEPDATRAERPEKKPKGPGLAQRIEEAISKAQRVSERQREVTEAAKSNIQTAAFNAPEVIPAVPIRYFAGPRKGKKLSEDIREVATAIKVDKKKGPIGAIEGSPAMTAGRHLADIAIHDEDIVEPKKREKLRDVLGTALGFGIGALVPGPGEEAGAAKAVKKGSRAFEDVYGALAGETGAAKVLESTDIKVAPDVFQFKGGFNPKTGVVTEGAKKYLKRKGGSIDVMWWEDGPHGAGYYVVDGHHRLAKKVAAGGGPIDTVVQEFKDPATGRLYGAMSNIMDDKGTAIDAAKVFRDSGLGKEELKAWGIDISGRNVSRGLALSTLGDDLFLRAVNSPKWEEIGVRIGQRVPDTDQQLAIAKLIDQQKRSMHPDEVSELIEEARSSGFGRKAADQLGMFGEPDAGEIESILPWRANIAHAVKQKLAEHKGAFKFATKEDRVAALSESGVGELDPELAGKLSDEAAKLMTDFEKNRRDPGPLRTILDEGAQRLVGGENPNAVRADTYKKILEELRAPSVTRREAPAPRVAPPEERFEEALEPAAEEPARAGTLDQALFGEEPPRAAILKLPEREKTFLVPDEQGGLLEVSEAERNAYKAGRLQDEMKIVEPPAPPEPVAPPPVDLRSLTAERNDYARPPVVPRETLPLRARRASIPPGSFTPEELAAPIRGAQRGGVQRLEVETAGERLIREAAERDRAAGGEVAPLRDLLEETRPVGPLATRGSAVQRLPVETPGERSIREAQEAVAEGIRAKGKARAEVRQAAARAAFNDAVTAGKTPEQANKIARRAAALVGRMETPPNIAGDLPPRPPVLPALTSAGDIPPAKGLARADKLRKIDVMLAKQVDVVRKLAGQAKGKEKIILETLAQRMYGVAKRTTEIENEWNAISRQIRKTVGRDTRAERLFISGLEDSKVELPPKLEILRRQVREWQDFYHETATKVLGGRDPITGTGPIGYISDYFPRYYDNLQRPIDEFMAGHEDEAIDALYSEYARQGTPLPRTAEVSARLRAELSKIVDRLTNPDRTRTFSGHLETPREWNMRGYLGDPKKPVQLWRSGEGIEALDRYGAEISQRISHAEGFGPNAKLLDMAADAVPDPMWRRYVETIGETLGRGVKRSPVDETIAPLTRAMRTWTIMYHYGKAFVDNEFQLWTNLAPYLLSHVDARDAARIQAQALGARYVELGRQFGITSKLARKNREFAEFTGSVAGRQIEQLHFMDQDPRAAARIAKIADAYATKLEKFEGVGTALGEGLRQGARLTTKPLRMGDESNSVGAARAGLALVEQVYDDIFHAAGTQKRARLASRAESMRHLVRADPQLAEELIMRANDRWPRSAVADLIDEAASEAAFTTTRETQFSAHPTFRRQFEITSEAGRTLAAGRSFSQNFADFFYERVYLPAKNEGNYKPLLALAAAFPVAAELSRDIRAVIDGRPIALTEDEKQGLFKTGAWQDVAAKRLANDFSQMWVLGWMAETLGTVLDRKGWHERLAGAFRAPIEVVQEVYGKPGILGTAIKAVGIAGAGPRAYAELEKRKLLDKPVGIRFGPGPFEIPLIGGTDKEKKRSPYYLDLTDTKRLVSRSKPKGQLGEMIRRNYKP